MENKQEIIQHFSDVLFKIKLIEAQVNIIKASDITKYTVSELKRINDFFIKTGNSIQDFKKDISDKKKKGVL